MPTEPIEVVAGGVVAPVGVGVAAFERGLRTAAPTAVETVGDVRVLVRRAELDAADHFRPNVLRRLDRIHQLALVAVAEALAALPFDRPDADRCAVCVGVGYGASAYAERQFAAFLERGPRSVNPLTIPIVMPNSVAAHLAIEHGFRGPAHTYATACAAGATAIGEAMWLLRTGRADLVIAGGVDALLAPGVVSFFARMEAMSRCFDAPELSSRPFDSGRDGFVIGEGAAFVALARAADSELGERRRLGSLLGYGATADAHHLVAPPDDGAGAADCMRDALADAGVEPQDVAHVNAHGTSTVRNDEAEALAIRSVFESHVPVVTASKGATGHLVGASGAVECLASLLAARTGQVDPVVGLREVDPAIDLDLAVGTPRAVSGSIALSNSFAFGGHNASLVVAP